MTSQTFSNTLCWNLYIHSRSAPTHTHTSLERLLLIAQRYRSSHQTKDGNFEVIYRPHGSAAPCGPRFVSGLNSHGCLPDRMSVRTYSYHWSRRTVVDCIFKFFYENLHRTTVSSFSYPISLSLSCKLLQFLSEGQRIEMPHINHIIYSVCESKRGRERCQTRKGCGRLLSNGPNV